MFGVYHSPQKDAIKSNSCGQCNVEDTADMVQCDDCDTWYHFSCAGVTDSVENHEWKCSKCTGKATADKDDKSVHKSKTKSILSSNSSRQRKINLELKRLEEEKAVEERYIQKKYAILALSDEDAESAHSGAISRTKEWVSNLPNEDQEHLEITSHHSLMRYHNTHTNQGAIPKSRCDEEAFPTKIQLSARKSLSKDLPIFNGKPEEWPLFYSSFVESTNLCGYSDPENLLRLQKCLKGRAFEVVSCHLLLPKNVPEVIRTLKMMFGRPEIIINSLLQKIRSEAPPKAEKLDSLVSYAIAVRNLCSTLDASGLEAHKNNPLLLQELVDKLPPQTKLNWAMHASYIDADISTFSKWLFDIAEAVTKVNPSIVCYKTFGNLHAHDTKTPAAQNSFPLCNKTHSVDTCERFSKMKLSDRWDKVRQFKLCRLCLTKHGNFRCSDAKCTVQGCEARHHKLLHRFQMNPTVTAHSSPTFGATTYFKILPVTLHNKEHFVETFAFLDDGSNVTLLERDLCDQLGLEGEMNNLCLKWTSETSRTEEDSMQVSVHISSRNKNAKRYELLNVRTVNKLSLPVQSVSRHDLASYQHLNSIPFSTYNGAIPKILIGLNNGYVCNTMKTIEGAVSDPCASKTRLGWVVHGGGDSSYANTVGHHKIEQCNCEHEMEKLQKIISDYLSLEDVGRKKCVSPENKRANFIMQTTTKRIGNRFETGLIWKEDTFEIPNSFPMASKRLQCLEKKLNPEHIPIITKQIDALVEKGYARKLSSEEVLNASGNLWYLPIFTVINPNKPGKVRLVWDAAAKIRGVSLNSMLLKGPDLMAPLLSVLYGFRMKKFAICGDIKEMFHQVLIRKEDQNAQRFIWRNGEVNRNPDIYVMQVMTFGAACSPSSAQYVKNKNALEFKTQYPRAVDSIIHHHYVDDLLDCADSESEAIELAEQVATIHSNGGFFIRNWKSNSNVVIDSLGELEEQNNVSIGSNIENSTEKVLGMWWSTTDDVFTYSLKLNRVNKDVLSGLKKPTKTDILRTLMSIFDPLGFLSSYVVYLKILLQEVWRTTEGWTDEVNAEVFKKWLVWIQLLPNIEKVRIPRWHSIQPGSSIQLHIFVDASEMAYAAVAYFRVESADGVQCSLVSAKVKVAPKQPVSIPRMELMAAVLGVRLANSISCTRNLSLQRRWFWSDSNTVLSWLNADPRNYKQFVMYRIGEVLDSSKSSEWRYIPTKDNVADDATKWKKSFEFDMQSRWFSGPTFLKDAESEWPSNNLKVQKPSEELRPHLIMVHSEVIDNNLIDFHRFSSWRRLLQTVVKLYTFIYKLKMKTKISKNHSYLIPETSKLIAMSENFLYHQIQSECFKDEIAALKYRKSDIPKASILYKCSPYIDENNVVRMNGRIGLASEIHEYTKRPIILPRKHYCTGLLIKHFHDKYHHINHDTCLNELRQWFYIPRLRVELKKVRKNCQLCKNLNSSPVVPEMAELPKARLASFIRPFSYVGLDYFGPLYVKVSRHQEKRWGVLFTCLTIRAVHIEVARDMSTDSCIMAIQNFIARRGTPIAIYCDNGTNFRGAETELNNALKKVDFETVSIKFTTSSTTWHFNPPAAPHMGGSWERLVQSVKKVLHQIIPNFVFKDETLYNGLLECERVINSRPLTYVDLESTTDEALTPNHFLLGSSNGDKPLGEFTKDDCVLRKNWRKVQYFADIFWKRWIQEYLPTIIKRTKWYQKSYSIEVGDVVIVVDPNLPRNNWPKGVVQSICKSKDGNVRSATVLTKSGIFKRPVARLAKLDVKPLMDSQINVG